MSFRRYLFLFCLTLLGASVPLLQSAAQSSSSTPSKAASKPAPGKDSSRDSGTVSDGVYRNSGFGFACKIPPGWVLRTEEMNAGDEATAAKESRAVPGQTAEGGCPHTGGCGRVLLAAFSRPPEARGEDVNGSIVIAAESVAAYPGLKDAGQYFGPLSEVAQARGFMVVNEPYDFLLGTKTVVRGDFQKDVGTRVMRQATLVMLARGYAVSFTFIGGAEDELEELVQELSFIVPRKAPR